MKTNLKAMITLVAIGATGALGPSSGIAGPTIVISPPAIVATVPVPDTYVWDGSEYVGMVGDQYYYLGPGNVWIQMDPPRLHRFQIWAKGHPDWRTHATHNDRYRNTRSSGRPPSTRTSPPAKQNQSPNKDSDHHDRGQSGPPQ